MGNPISDTPKGKLQEGASPKIIDNPHLTPMPAETPHVPTKPAPGQSVMPATNAELLPPTRAPGGRGMEPFKQPVNPSPSASPKPMGDMKARPVAVEETALSYLRLRIRVTDGRMRVVAAQTVDGPLALSTSFVGQHAYEIMLDAHPIAVEGLPDIGVSRSYPRPGEHEHHITSRPTFEFTVRIPRTALPGDALARLRVTLYRFPDASPKTAAGPLTRQFGQQATVVALMDGVHADHIEPQALEPLKRLFPLSFAAPNTDSPMPRPKRPPVR